MHIEIRDRGRGPEIAGSRITVYDVLAETQAGATPEQLAQWFDLDVAQVRAALQYIDDHRDQVTHDYEEIKARHVRGNPPEVEEKLRRTRAKYAPLLDRLRSSERGEKNGHAWPPPGNGRRYCLPTLLATVCRRY